MAATVLSNGNMNLFAPTLKSCGSDDSIGRQRLAKYSVLRRLCKTLYGETLLCRDTSSDTAQDKLVVLKRIDLAELRENTVGGHENPVEERHVMQVLRRAGGHRHIVSYEPQGAGMFVERGNLFIAMEYCEDGDLFDVLEQHPQGFVTQREALSLVHQIALGVAFLHNNGIAHRDLSLENVLLHRGVAKLCDFGLSCDATRRCSETVGKVSYMAPEVAQGLVYDPKAADMWSLGVMLFVLITGSPLIADEAQQKKMLRVLAKYGVAKVLQLWGMNDRVNSVTLALMSSLLQIDPARRPSVASVLRNPVFWTMTAVQR